MNIAEMRDFLNEKHDQYNNRDFIEEDPISIPHRFTQKEDIEIVAFLTATLSWGKRDMIIRAGDQLCNIMGQQPHDFIRNYSPGLADFKYRTFNNVDLNVMFKGLQHLYLNHDGLAPTFQGENLFERINHFREAFFGFGMSPDEMRTHKHIANPLKGSSAKRLCMFLRWMIREDKRGVDFGIWDHFSTAELNCPLDVHTGNVGRALGLLTRKQDDWKAVIELSDNLRLLDPVDPIRYDFALFGLGRFEGFK